METKTMNAIYSTDSFAVLNENGNNAPVAIKTEQRTMFGKTYFVSHYAGLYKNSRYIGQEHGSTFEVSRSNAIEAFEAQCEGRTFVK
jgi:hypothetical protein